MLGVVVRCRFACYDRQWYRHHLYSAARAAEQQPDGRCQGHFASGWLGVGVRNHQCFGFSRPGISVSVTPTPDTVLIGTTTQFTATVANDPTNMGVTWTVTCSSTPCGTISPAATASGSPTTYTAPTTLPTGNLAVSVIATSVADPTAIFGLNFTVPGTTVSIDSVSAAEVPAGGMVQIVASVTNDPTNKGVTWTVACDTPPCGTVSPAATASGAATTYTAPATPPASDLNVAITATSVFNTGASNIAEVTVGAVAISAAPVSALIPENVTQSFTAIVSQRSRREGRYLDAYAERDRLRSCLWRSLAFHDRKRRRHHLHGSGRRTGQSDGVT